MVKRIIATLAAAALILVLVTCPALSASLGISPSSVELEVPGDGSARADLRVHYFSGEIRVSMVDIPLEVEPEILHVDALNEPVDIQLTIYGNDSLGSQVYNGYIKFLGMSGGMVGIAVQVKARVTNVVEGQPLPVEIADSEPSPTPEQGTPEETASAPTRTLADTTESATTEWPILPLAGIAAATVVIVTLIVTFMRRARH